MLHRGGYWGEACIRSIRAAICRPEKAAVSSRSSDLAQVGFHRKENGASKASPLPILVRVSGAFVRITLADPKVTDEAKAKPA